MLLALLLFVGYLRVLYYIFFQSKDKLPVWRVALFLLSCIPLFSSFYFFNKEITILFIYKYKLYLRVFFIISLLFFVYADWKIVENSGDEKRKSDTRKELLALAVAIITYIGIGPNLWVGLLHECGLT